MGRRKVEMKRIEDKSSRQVTFSKRRSGLIKKARELSILCDVQVALVVFSSRGRLYEFCNGSSLSEILERYHVSIGKDGQTSSDLLNESTQVTIQTCTEVVQNVHRCLDAPNSDEISLAELIHMETQLNIHLTNIRARKYQLMMESKIALQEQERALREENALLEKEIADMQNKQGTTSKEGLIFDNLLDEKALDREHKETLLLLP